ncbi:hypothetical protein IQ251_00985 [Saccharopolyspora sp. HNM0983]|uniref:Uncharacterized protein n=1 Tax=Saccharopolyspora montiporae TaxID=2781240 RepID=A0A929FYS6_9PSEU|nr:hypothetical protein [Saccharopolyspora sp. HNM0983]MBE9373012.1 hypothetical protein [Saccharopolyspora sp. HNM0983]
MRSYRWVHPASGSWVRVEFDGEHPVVHQTGPRKLWDEAEPVLDTWNRLG